MYSCNILHREFLNSVPEVRQSRSKGTLTLKSFCSAVRPERYRMLTIGVMAQFKSQHANMSTSVFDHVCDLKLMYDDSSM